MKNPFIETFWGVLFFVLLLLVVTWIAKRKGFFKLPPETKPPITLKQAGGAFLIYLVGALLIIPFFIVLTRIATDSLQNLNSFSFQQKSWLQLLGLVLLCCLLIGYCFKISKEVRRFIFWGDERASSERFFQSLQGGVIGLIVSYPSVLLSSALSNLLADWFWGETHLKQVAVNQLKMTIGYPFLFSTLALIVIFIVPFTEELLFRGFLQNLLKKWLGRSWAIILTAIIFSCFHFSQEQGKGNFQLIISLLTLSCFLGIVYEKYRSLWAPIALHATFNALNVLAIFFET